MEEQTVFEFEDRPVIKGFPELRWTGKRPYRNTQYFPAQLKERYGEEKDGWINKIFWGDNLQVMSHLMMDFRGKIDLIYIDPPFDSKADYKKTIALRGKNVANDRTSFEEKQYSDIWNNDEYLQFMYERLIILRELLSDTGSIYLHCDYRKSSHLRIIMDEIFGLDSFVNEIIWCYSGPGYWKDRWVRKHDTIIFFTKESSYVFNPQFTNYKTGIHVSKEGSVLTYGGGIKESNSAELEDRGKPLEDWWDDIYTADRKRSELLGYPTQKPEALLERIIKASTNPGDIVFDCFMGSGTTQAVAMKLGRRFIGADINLGAINTTIKRLLNVSDSLSLETEESNKKKEQPELSAERAPEYALLTSEDIEEYNKRYIGFEVYNVNNYDFFRNPVEAKSLLIEALGIQPSNQAALWDGELDGRMVKIMPINRIASKADLESLKSNLPYRVYEKRKEQNPNTAAEKITLICMGHEPDLKASLESDLKSYKIEVEIFDILRDKKELQFKRDAEAEIVKEGENLVIRSFYPLNLMQKLSMQKDAVESWQELVESIAIDWNYDGAVLNPSVLDVPGDKEFVKGIYKIPKNAGTIKVKITDLLSEILEVEVKL